MSKNKTIFSAREVHCERSHASADDLIRSVLQEVLTTMRNWHRATAKRGPGQSVGV